MSPTEPERRPARPEGASPVTEPIDGRQATNTGHPPENLIFDRAILSVREWAVVFVAKGNVAFDQARKAFP